MFTIVSEGLSERVEEKNRAKNVQKQGTSYSTVIAHLQERFRTGVGDALRINSRDTPMILYCNWQVEGTGSE